MGPYKAIIASFEVQSEGISCFQNCFHTGLRKGIITAHVAKWAKVMFSQACVTHSVQVGGGEVTPNGSWDRSHGHRWEVVWTSTPLDRTTPPDRTTRPPSLDRTTTPWTGPPPNPSPQTGPPPPNPPPGYIQATVNGWAVRILPECIFVTKVLKNWGFVHTNITRPKFLR